MTKLDGKTAIVTGAGNGIGRATAEKLASEGARVIVNDLDAACANQVIDDITRSGGTAAACVGNVTDQDFAERVVAAASERFGGLDIIVNNAGYIADALIQKMSDQQWCAMLDVHLTAPFRILRAAQPVMSALRKAEMARGEEVFRKVVNVSSMSGTRGNIGQSNYSSAKAGLIGLTRTLAKEWGRMRVNVNCVAFGLIITRATRVEDDAGARVGLRAEVLERLAAGIPFERGGTPEEAAGAIYMLCSPESNYVTGQVIECNGGMSM